MILERECSSSTLVAVQKYFANKGMVITGLSEWTGQNNKLYGDAHYNCIRNDGKEFSLNIDFKKQTKDDCFIYIELLYIRADGTPDGWLWNQNIDMAIYELKDGRVFAITHQQLLQIARAYNTDAMWNSSVVYSKNPAQFEIERKWITQKLDEQNVFPIKLPDIVIGPDNSHIRACYNFNTYENKRVLSGFSMALEPIVLEKFQIN